MPVCQFFIIFYQVDLFSLYNIKTSRIDAMKIDTMHCNERLCVHWQLQELIVTFFWRSFSQRIFLLSLSFFCFAQKATHTLTHSVRSGSQSPTNSRSQNTKIIRINQENFNTFYSVHNRQKTQKRSFFLKYQSTKTQDITQHCLLR